MRLIPIFLLHPAQDWCSMLYFQFSSVLEISAQLLRVMQGSCKALPHHNTAVKPQPPHELIQMEKWVNSKPTSERQRPDLHRSLWSPFPPLHLIFTSSFSFLFPVLSCIAQHRELPLVAALFQNPAPIDATHEGLLDLLRPPQCFPSLLPKSHLIHPLIPPLIGAAAPLTCAHQVVP